MALSKRDEIELRGELASLSYDLPLGSTSLVKALVDDLQSTTQAYSSLQAQEETLFASASVPAPRSAAADRASGSARTARPGATSWPGNGTRGARPVNAMPSSLRPLSPFALSTGILLRYFLQ